MALRAWTPADLGSATCLARFKITEGVTVIDGGIDRWTSSVGTAYAQAESAAQRPAFNASSAIDGRAEGRGTNAGRTRLKIYNKDNWPYNNDPFCYMVVAASSGVSTDSTAFGWGADNSGMLFKPDRIICKLRDYDLHSGMNVVNRWRTGIAMFRGGTPGSWESRNTGQDVQIGSTRADASNYNAFLFARPDFGDRYMDGAIREVVLFQGVPSNDDIMRLQGYAAWDNGTVGDLPANHIYKTAAPTVDDGVTAPVLTPAYGTTNTTLAPIQSASEGTSKLKATLAATLADLLSTAAATLKNTGSTNALFDNLSTSTSGKIAVKAATLTPFDGMVMESSAKLLTKAAFEYQLQDMGINASTAFRISGTTDYTFDTLTGEFSASAKNGGQVFSFLNPLSSSSGTKLKVKGNVSKTLLALKSVSAATAKIKADSSTSFDGLYSLSAASIGQRVDLNAYLDPLTGTGSSKAYIKAAANMLLNAMYVTGDSDLEVVGIVGTLLSELVTEATGGIKIKSTAFGMFSPLTGDMSADTDRATIKTDGAATVSFEAMSMNALANLRVLGDVRISFNALTGAYTGTVTVDGVSDSLLAPIGLVAASKTTLSGATSYTLEPLGVGTLGTLKIIGNSSNLLDSLSTDIYSQSKAKAELLAGLDGLTLVAHGVPIRVIIYVPPLRVAKSTSANRVVVVPPQRRISFSR